MKQFAARRRMMVDTQVRPSDVTKFPIIDAMLAVPREVFVPDALAEAAYAGENIDLGQGRVILEPRTFAKMLDAIDIQPEDLVLDVGAAYGYSSAILARMAQAVVALEEDEQMANEAQAMFVDQNADNAIVHQGPLAEGAEEHGPYDAILIQGGVEKVPEAFARQLKDKGRIIALFVQDTLGVVRIGYKSAGTISWRYEFNASAPVLPGFETSHVFAL